MFESIDIDKIMVSMFQLIIPPALLLFNFGHDKAFFVYRYIIIKNDYFTDKENGIEIKIAQFIL